MTREAVLLVDTLYRSHFTVIFTLTPFGLQRFNYLIMKILWKCEKKLAEWLQSGPEHLKYTPVGPIWAK